MKAILILFLISLSTLNVFSQSLRFGIGYQEFPFDGKVLTTYRPSNQAGDLILSEEVSDKVEAISFLLGFKLPVYSLSDQLRICVASDIIGIYWVEESAGVQNFQGQVLSSSSGTGLFGFQCPVYGTIEFNVKDERGNLTGLNAEIGGGLMFQGIDNSLIVPFKGKHFIPCTKAAVGYNHWQFAFLYSLSKFEDAYPSNINDIPRLEVGNYSFHLYYQLPL